MAVGDPGRPHLRLTPDAVLFRDGSENRGIVPWEQVERVLRPEPLIDAAARLARIAAPRPSGH